MLGLITCFFNPTNSKTLRSNYIEFRKHLKHPIVTVELAFGSQPFFIEDAIQIRGNDENLMWQKERLLNIALESLPRNITKIAWLDADVIFENENWLIEAEKKLEENPIVQLFDSVYEVSPNNTSVHCGMSFGKYLKETGKSHWDNQLVPSIGLAWSARREVLENGFFDLGIVGAGDMYLLLACLNQWKSSYIMCMPPKMRREYLLWGWKLAEKVQSNIGFINGRVQHLHHGSPKNRQYLKRLEILVRNEFSPSFDLFKNKNQIWGFNSNKPQLQKEIQMYFFNRKTDE